MAAALSGASLSQLSHWRKRSNPVLVPEISADPPLYSYRDLVALRTFVYLRRRKRVSLQKIRTALNTLRDLGEIEHLSQYRLVADGKSIVLVHPDDREPVDLVLRPGQQVLVMIGDVLRSFAADGFEVPDLRRPREQISVDPQVRGGRPVVSGTRVDFELVAGLVRDGISPDEVHHYYPGVTAQAAADAADFAGDVDRFTQRKSSRQRAGRLVRRVA
jgi:uncharacterized protein (DUF433 family)